MVSNWKINGETLILTFVCIDACVRYWPDHGLVFECVTCFYFFFSLNSALNKLFIFSLLSEFNRISLGYLDQCFRTNEELTHQLLIYNPKGWSRETCLSLAYSFEHEEFLAHGICQALLTEIWAGKMKSSQESSLKVRLFGAHSSALCFQPLN